MAPFSLLAHDIRSPLAAVDMALGGLDRAADEDRPALVAVARRQTARLLGLARDLLDLAASEQGRLTLRREPTVLSQVVTRALSYSDPAGAVTVDVPGDLIVDVDADRLEQAIVTLIVNANHHGRPPVKITARSAGDRSVTIEVRDHGEGVPDVLQADLFQAFNRHADVSDRASVGLGLWVTAQLIDAHDGTINYRQAPDGGATFTITLPAPDTLGANDGAPVAPPTSDDAAAPVRNTRSPR